MIRSSFLYFIIILLYGICTAEASDVPTNAVTLIFDLNKSVYLSACEDNDEWTLKKLNKIHEASSYLPSDIKDISTVRGSIDCGYKEAQCKIKYTKHKYFKEDTKNYKHTWFVRSYPTVYSEDERGKRLINMQNILGGLSENMLEFIPIDNSIDSESSIIAIEKSIAQSVDNTEYQFFDVKAEHEFDEGKALCRVSKRRWGSTLPDQCIITRFKNANGHYVLGLVERKPYYIRICNTSARFEVMQQLSFEKINSDRFKSHLLNSLTGNELQMDSNRIDVEGTTESGITVYATAGPRLSPINARFREQLDVTLRFKPSRASSLRVKGHLAAWVSRQNTDPSGSWRMPEQSYYSELEAMLRNAVNNAFDAECKDGDKQSVNKESPYGRIRVCQ